MKTALSIAGSDPSGGAGIQADLKTMTMHGVYAMSAVSAEHHRRPGGTGVLPRISRPPAGLYLF